MKAKCDLEPMRKEVVHESSHEISWHQTSAWSEVDTKPGMKMVASQQDTSLQSNLDGLLQQNCGFENWHVHASGLESWTESFGFPMEARAKLVESQRACDSNSRACLADMQPPGLDLFSTLQIKVGAAELDVQDTQQSKDVEAGQHGHDAWHAAALDSNADRGLIDKWAESGQT